MVYVLVRLRTETCPAMDKESLSNFQEVQNFLEVGQGQGVGQATRPIPYKILSRNGQLFGPYTLKRAIKGSFYALAADLRM